MEAGCAAFFLIIRTAISNPYAMGRLSFRPAVLMSVFVPFGLGQTISQNNGNETVLPIWGLSTVVQGGTSPLCRSTRQLFREALAAGHGLTLSNPGFDSSNSPNTSSAYTLWYDTNGANYSDRYALGYDVCALVGLSLNYNTQLRGQSDNGSCTATLDSPCITAIQATVQQYAAWYTTPSQGTPSNLTGTSLPNVCRLLTHALIENFPNQCSYFFEDKLDGLAYPLTSYGDQYQTGLIPSCTLNGTWQNALSFYNNNSQSIYDAWVDSVTPVILVWMPIADASFQTSITEVVSDIWCGRITNLSADSYVPPALPSPTPVAYMTNTGSNSTSSNISAVGSMSASGMSSSDAISWGAIAGIVMA
ncbi:hypothetical protein Tdes44962_MAKER06644 [Teratosphaeria destructans]|uniref:Uncharacterized protein n=1 Tax=Teratosphaeria destructans TaxID=418781 RepID=A0A9W7T1A7_9PEZI|nr:hypothetical protein Tdes44962_MAKER06644 [Teratosphaeria destructans]